MNHNSPELKNTCGDTVQRGQKVDIERILKTPPHPNQENFIRNFHEYERMREKPSIAEKKCLVKLV